jgi:hypothetical protein
MKLTAEQKARALEPRTLELKSIDLEVLRYALEALLDPDCDSEIFDITSDPDYEQETYGMKVREKIEQLKTKIFKVQIGEDEGRERGKVPCAACAYEARNGCKIEDPSKHDPSCQERNVL